MSLDRFLGLAGSVGVCRHCCTETNLVGRRPTVQIYIAGNGVALCIPVVGESYVCAKAAISLERSNSFSSPEDCVQIHWTPFPDPSQS